MTVTWQPFIRYHSPGRFLSRNITKNAEIHPPTIRDVIIEQPLCSRNMADVSRNMADVSVIEFIPANKKVEAAALYDDGL